MAFDPIDFNLQTLACVEKQVMDQIQNTDLTAGKIFLPTLSLICPSLGDHGSSELSLGEVVDLFGQALVTREERTNDPLPVDYQVIEKLSFLASEYLNIVSHGIEAMRQALAGWHLDEVTPERIQDLGGLCAKLKVVVQGLERNFGRLDARFKREKIKVVGEPILSRFWRLLSFSGEYLDLDAQRNLNTAHQELESDFQRLRDHYSDYRRLMQRATSSLNKFEDQPYQIFLSLEDEEQKLLREVYLFCKMDEINDGGKIFPERHLDVIVAKRLPLSRALPGFAAYYESLDHALFEESRILKDEAARGELDSEAGKETVELWLDARRQETQTLKYMIYRLREFLLRTNPDPYVNTRMGWHDRQLGPEPKQTEPLQVLSRSLRRLDNLFYRLAEAVHEFERSKVEAQWKENVLLVGEIFSMIRQLSQQDHEEVAKHFADNLLQKWVELDEVCSFNKEDVSYDEFLLRKALIYDSFLVLLNKPKFCELYRQHLAIRGLFKDPAQRKRLKTLQAYLRNWQGQPQQVEDFLVGAEEYLAKVEEDIEGAAFEERRKEFLEFLYSYHRFCRQGRKVVCQQGTEDRWQRVLDHIQRLDGVFYKSEQSYLLGMREGNPE